MIEYRTSAHFRKLWRGQRSSSLNFLWLHHTLNSNLSMIFRHSLHVHFFNHFPYLDVVLWWRLQGMGFERGWGDTAQKVSEMVHLLLDILQAPDPSVLETFLGRIPMVFNVVILSPHGYFGQANVLGLPDTGGQVDLIQSFHICGIQGRSSG